MLHGLTQQGLAGEETGRAAVMDSGAVPHIVASLSDADNAVRLAAVWCACCSAAAQRSKIPRRTSCVPVSAGPYVC